MNKTSDNNPYVGPRPFEKGDSQFFHGRDQEAEELLDLLIAERLVLLYAPSGAGKTSLIQAKLIDALEGARFSVLPPIRAFERGHHPDEETKPLNGNRFIQRLLEVLLPGEQLADLAALAAGKRLKDILSEPWARQVLIIDQFEEVLTLDPKDLGAKREFFEQLGEALESSYRFALFAIREEYLGPLQQFLHFIPTQLSTTYRLNLLTQDQAIKAIQKPVGGKFRAAGTLVEDLLAKSEYVEPLLLQVVCKDLWDKYPGLDIGEKELEEYGKVDQALENYYNQTISKLAPYDSELEWKIRRWFGQQLITESDTRARVTYKEIKSGGLENEFIAELEDAHLVRRESMPHRDLSWVELSHDRLITVVRKANTDWNRKHHLGAFLPEAAEHWQNSDRSRRLLLAGKDLDRAMKWAQDHAELITPREQKFLEESRLESQSSRWRRALGIIAGLALIAIILVVFLNNAKKEGLAAKAEINLEIDPEQSLRLAIKAYRSWSKYFFVETGESILQRALQGRITKQFLSNKELKGKAHNGVVSEIVFDPNGKFVLTSCFDGALQKWTRNEKSKYFEKDPQKDPEKLKKEGIRSLALSPDGTRMALGGLEGTIELRDISSGQVIRGPWETTKVDNGAAEKKDRIPGLVFNPVHGEFLAAVSWDGWLKVFNVKTQEKVFEYPDPRRKKISGVAFSPDGRWMASGGDDYRVWVWDIQSRNPKEWKMEPNWKKSQTAVGDEGHKGLVMTLAFSPDGEWVISGSDDTTIKVWKRESGQLQNTLFGHQDTVLKIAVNAKLPGIFASAGDDAKVKIWNYSTGKELLELPHQRSVLGLAFSRDGQWLSTGSEDGVVRIYNYQNLKVSPATVRTIAFHPAQTTLFVTGNSDNKVRLWDMKSSKFKPLFQPDENKKENEREKGNITQVMFSPDGHYITAAIGNKVIIWSGEEWGQFRCFQAEDRINSLAFHPQSQILAAGLCDGSIQLWEVAGDKPPYYWKNFVKGNAYASAFSPDGWLAVGNWQNQIASWAPPGLQNQVDMEKIKGILEKIAKQIKHMGDAAKIPMPIYSLAFSPDGQHLLVGTDKKLLIFQMATGKLESPLTGFSRPVVRIIFSKDGKQLATAAWDGTAVVWDWATRSRLNTYQVRTPVNDVGFSSDGARLGIACGSNQAYLYWLNKEELEENVRIVTKNEGYLFESAGQ